MEGNQSHYKIKKGELVLLFILFLIGGSLIFAVGIRLGKNILQNDCQAILENNQKRIEELEAKVDPETKTVEETTVVLENNNTSEGDKVKKAYGELGIKEITDEIKGKYTIQISSYQDEEEAQREARSLLDDGYKMAYYMEAEIPGKGLWYRVGIGFFDKKSSADMFAEMLKKQGKITSYLVRRVD